MVKKLLRQFWNFSPSTKFCILSPLFPAIVLLIYVTAFSPFKGDAKDHVGPLENHQRLEPRPPETSKAGAPQLPPLDEDAKEDLGSIVFTEGKFSDDYLVVTFGPADTISIGSIEIDCKTGNVKIQEGVTMDEASREFWRAVEQMCREIP